MKKITDTMEQISKKVVNGYKKIENATVTGYKKIEKGVVECFAAVSDKCIAILFTKTGETVAEAKERLAGKK